MNEIKLKDAIDFFEKRGIPAKIERMIDEKGRGIIIIEPDLAG